MSTPFICILRCDFFFTTYCTALPAFRELLKVDIHAGNRVTLTARPDRIEKIGAHI